MRPDGSDSRFPAKRMSVGLLEHMVYFFNADTMKWVSDEYYRLAHICICSDLTKLHALSIEKCPVDYKQWLTIMYCQFGNKWANLHLGPMWSAVSIGKGGPKDTMHTPDGSYMLLNMGQCLLKWHIAIFI